MAGTVLPFRPLENVYAIGPIVCSRPGVGPFTQIGLVGWVPPDLIGNSKGGAMSFIGHQEPTVLKPVLKTVAAHRAKASVAETAPTAFNNSHGHSLTGFECR